MRNWQLRLAELWLLVAAFATPRVALGLDPSFGPEYASKKPARVDHMTTYFPELGGINGQCGGGGGIAPKDPCKHFLDDFIDGKVTDCVVAATQRRGGSSALYGCKAEVGILSQAVGKPVVVCFADVYAAKESEGSVGTNGQVQRSKFDVASRAHSKYAGPVNSAPGGMVTCDGRLPDTQNKNRPIDRDPEAKSPPQAGGGGSPGGGSGGGSPGGGNPDPAAQYPKGNPPPLPKGNVADSRVPPEKIGVTKPDGPKGDPKNDPSQITKSPSPFLPSASSGGGDEGSRKPANSALAEARNTSAASASVGGSGGGGGLSGGGLVSPPAGSSSGGTRSSDSSGAPGGFGGGGGGGSYGGSSSSGSSSSSPSPSGEPASVAKEPEAPAEGSGELAAGDGTGSGPEGELSGIGSLDDPSLFERVHAYYVKLQQGGSR